MSKLEVSLPKEPSVRKAVPEKFILDATAGLRMMWNDRQFPHCLYVDIRPEVHPDMIADFRDLKSISDKSFKLIIFDPPHHLEELPSKHFRDCYGTPLKKETWHQDIIDAFNELWRILADFGIILFKWTTIHIKAEEVLRILPKKPLIQQTIVGHSGKRNRSQTLWFCFMKIPEEVKV